MNGGRRRIPILQPRFSVSPALSDIRTAADRLAGTAHRTPVLTSTSLDALAGATLHFKCENFQRGGAYKFRGALNAVDRKSTRLNSSH